MDRLATALRHLSDFLAVLAGIAVSALTLLVVISAFMRYAVGAPFHFSDELVGLLYLASAFLTLPYGVARNQTIRVTLLVDKVRGRKKAVLDALAGLIVLVFSAWFAAIAGEYAHFNYSIGALTEQGEFSLGLWTAVMPLGSAVVALLASLHLCRMIGALLAPGGAAR